MSSTHQTNPVVSKTAVTDGTHINFQHDNRTPGDVCVVLMHSLAMDHKFWRLVAPELAKQAPVVCLDARGHGDSDKPAGPYSMEVFARDVRDVIQHLGYKKVVIAGASMGGCISLQFALDYPDMTAALGLIDTTSWYGPTSVKDWQGRGDKAHTDGFASMVDFQTTRWFSDAFREQNPDLVQSCVDTFLKNDVEAYRATCHAMGAFNAHERVANVAVPTAIIVGSEDYAAPVAMSEHMHKAIAGSTLNVLEGARHLTPLETPDVIVAELGRLLAGAQSD